MKQLTLFFCLGISCSMNYSFSQSVHSGIIHTTESGEESNLLKLHLEGDLNETILTLINTEFAKYPEISSFHLDLATNKLYIKYNNSLDPNFIMGILERVTIRAYYLNQSGSQVRYTKTGTESFRR
ncbi:MAG: hypothetical protein ACOVO3_11580 [Fluviicola sp.]